jgi:hypothetical protein
VKPVLKFMALSLLFVLAACTQISVPSLDAQSGSSKLFIQSAIENSDHTVTLPLYQGVSGGKAVWFIVLDASSSNAADSWRVNRSNKLANAKGTTAVMKVSRDAQGRIVFPATVDFAPVRVVVPTPGTGFPPVDARPGAIGQAGYSPLIQLSDGTILNAPQIANDTGKADKAVTIDFNNKTVRYELTDGFSNDKPVRYISTDASDAGAAALENVTFAPALNAAPFAGGDGTDSARASLAAFTNGQTGVNNPQRQGLNSALLGEGDPRNILAWTPNQGRYSPLWDVHLSTWAAGQQATLQTDFDDVQDLADESKVTAPDGTSWKPSNFIVNCPIISEN